MNYRHVFHAGNFADVFKHILLVRLLHAVQRKDKGFAYIETHAGAGRYDLRAPAARETGEHRDGIARLWAEEDTGESDLARYLRAVRAFNSDGRLRYYPGSPRIARLQLRPQDRMRLAEAQAEECARLQREFARDAQVAVQCGDGHMAFKAWVPPPERRGLVLIDPPYESREEWQRVLDTLALGARRWAQGCYAVWYPLKAGAPPVRFLSGVARTGLHKVLRAELSVWPSDTPFRLNGCGMLVANPPFQWELGLGAILTSLAQRLRQGPRADAAVEWLVAP